MSQESDLDILKRWWASLVGSIPEQVRGLWFGIADLLDESQVPHRHLYAAGTHDFDQDDDTGDWAVDPFWWPEERYVQVPTLAATINDPDYRVGLNRGAELVTELTPWIDAEWVQGVAVGYDDGDFLIVWHQQSVHD